MCLFSGKLKRGIREEGVYNKKGFDLVFPLPGMLLLLHFRSKKTLFVCPLPPSSCILDSFFSCCACMYILLPFFSVRYEKRPLLPASGFRFALLCFLDDDGEKEEKRCVWSDRFSARFAHVAICRSGMLADAGVWDVCM